MSGGDRSSALSNRYGPLELAVMERAWRDGTVDVRTILTSLTRDGHDIAYSTVKTIMERLTVKGELARERQGRQFVYTPVRSRADTEALAAHGMVEELLERHSELAVSFFVDRARREPEQLARLRQALRDMEDEAGTSDA